MNDEKTTEIELPRSISSNIVRVNFTERRKASASAAPAHSEQAVVAYPLRRTNAPATRPQAEWSTPWWVRLAALAAILLLSLFVL